MTFTPRCPTCRQPFTWEGNPHRPFCSERCQLIDLGAWASERYRIAGEAIDQSADDESDDESDEE
jgi:endogenous inhibitor of DNA gyrase (YacG/DUF329 family)